MNLPIFTEPVDRKPVNPHALEIATRLIALHSFAGMTDDFDELADLFPILVGLETDLAKIIGVETVDHPSDGQLVAYARKYFLAKDQLLGQP